MENCTKSVTLATNEINPVSETTDDLANVEKEDRKNSCLSHYFNTSTLTDKKKKKETCVQKTKVMFTCMIPPPNEVGSEIYEKKYYPKEDGIKLFHHLKISYPP